MFRARRFALTIAGLGLAAALLATACVSHLVAMPGQTLRGAPPPADDARRARMTELRRVVDQLATSIGERNVHRAPAALAQTSAWLHGELTALGYRVDALAWDEGGVRVENLTVERQGSTWPTQVIVVGAHYDSAPGTPGADDNASGVASLLWLARSWATKTPARTVRFVFFTNEEPPWFGSEHMGSAHAAAEAGQHHDDIRAMLSLETMAYASAEPASQHSPWPLSQVTPSTGDFIAFVSDSSSRALTERCVARFRAEGVAPAEGVAAPAFIQGIDWSDHGPYFRAGYPSVMVTDTAPFRNPQYHRPLDLPAALDFDFLARVTQGLEGVLESLANDK